MSTRSSAVPRRAVLLLSLLPLLAAPGCGGGPTAVDGERYGLASIDGALPGALPGSADTEVTGGTLTVHPDGRLEQELTLRCRPGQTCTVSETWRRMSGSLDRAAGPPGSDGLVRWSTGLEAVAVVSSGSVRLDYPLPPSQGFGTAAFHFER